MSEELKIGSVIVPTDEEMEVMRLLVENTDTVRAAFALASENVKLAMREMRDAVRELYPCLDEWRVTVKHPRDDDIKIVVVGRLE